MQFEKTHWIATVLSNYSIKNIEMQILTELKYSDKTKWLQISNKKYRGWEKCVNGPL